MYPAIRIPVSTPFSFQMNLDYLSRSPDECLYQIQNGKLYKTISVGQQTPLFEISGDEPGFLVVKKMDDDEHWESDVIDAVTAYIREWFDLDNDLAPFYAMAREDAILNGVVDRLYGLRNMGIPDLFEALCWGIIGQQINLAFAYILKRRFVESFGNKVSHSNLTCWLFPTPERIASLEISDLTALKMTTKKAEYLIGVARLIVNGEISKEMLLKTESFKASEKRLTSIRGIGPWTANYVMMRCLRYPTAFPIDDVGLHLAIKSVLQMEQKPTVAHIRELSAGWEGWEAYATFYLWRVLY